MIRTAVLAVVLFACGHRATAPSPASPPLVQQTPLPVPWFPAANTTVSCPASYEAAKGVCTTSGQESGDCAYAEGTCRCAGPPLWRYGGCTGNDYPRQPITFSWSCVPAVDWQGCPATAPLVGAPCDAHAVCRYRSSEETDPCNRSRPTKELRSCVNGKWENGFGVHSK